MPVLESTTVLGFAPPTPGVALGPTERGMEPTFNSDALSRDVFSISFLRRGLQWKEYSE